MYQLLDDVGIHLKSTFETSLCQHKDADEGNPISVNT